MELMMTSNEDLGFTFNEKSGEFTIFHGSIKATTLRGSKAADFKSDVEELSFSDLQQLMARLTGNYKHGNEKVARNHPRNKR
jgi:hypothetical protein